MSEGGVAEGAERSGSLLPGALSVETKHFPESYDSFLHVIKPEGGLWDPLVTVSWSEIPNT